MDCLTNNKMDPNLQRFIDPNSYMTSFTSRHGRLTSTPAIDYISPGVGLTTRLYSMYVPLYSQKPKYSISKETQVEKETNLQQEGSGNSNLTNE
jgi:hypothetical protein